MTKLKSLNEFEDSTLCLDSEKMCKIVGGNMDTYPRSHKTLYHTTLNNTDNSTRYDTDGINENGGWDNKWSTGTWVYCGDCKAL
jgi:hypothetical protein